MTALLGWTGATVGSAIGWWVGAKYGVFTAFASSVVGTGVGLYVGRRIAERLVE